MPESKGGHTRKQTEAPIIKTVERMFTVLLEIHAEEKAAPDQIIRSTIIPVVQANTMEKRI